MNELPRDRRILIAVDKTEHARKAVMYVADFLGGVPGVHACILNIIAEPSEDYFATKEEKCEWIKNHLAESGQMLEQYRAVLVQAGFEEENVTTRSAIKNTPSIAEGILDEQEKLGCCTVVLGRRGISKKEEFIFSSTSSKILHSKKSCAVWVVE